MFEKCTCGYDGEPILSWYYGNNRSCYVYRCANYCGLSAEGDTMNKARMNFNEKIKMRKASKKGTELHKLIESTPYEPYIKPLPGKNLLDGSVDALTYCVNDILTTKYFWGEFHNPNEIKNVIFNDPATIVFWCDGTKTVVKCDEDDYYDPEKGLAMAISKRFLGDKGNYYNEFKKWLPEEKKSTPLPDINNLIPKEAVPQLSTKEIVDNISKSINDSLKNMRIG